ncbi:hypothetical protein C8Q79DRAFT_668619 [Trametes meyenii]|nr:hypothetical protein C8Q79DRAFT_668619 [Trametes meyenii]
MQEATVYRDDIVDRASTQQATGFACVASITFMAWDALISFSEEVEFVWQKPNGWLRWLYVFLRYGLLLVAIALFSYFSVPGRKPSTNAQCNFNTLIEAIVLASAVIAVQIVLIIRGTSLEHRLDILFTEAHATVYALYNRSRKLLLSLIVGCAASLCASILGSSFASGKFRYDGQCLLTSAPPTMLLAWLSPTALEFALFVLTLAKFRESRREGLGRLPILETMVRDGTWAFLLAFVVMTFNAFIYTRVVHPNTSGVAYACTLSTLSFIGSRVLLNLKRLTAAPHLTWEVSSNLSEICFDQVTCTPYPPRFSEGCNGSEA